VLTLVPGAVTPVSAAGLSTAFTHVGFHPPIPVLGDLYSGLMHPLTWQFFVPVIVPMGLFSVLGSIQNLESAEAAGDAFPSAPCLAVNGIGTIVAAAFGSCFPTTIYIGHPGWKALGARAGYSVLNGVFFVVIALLGLSHAVSAIVPIEAGMAIVLWIGIVITAQAFQATPPRHAPAVALGLFPAIAGWGVMILTQTLGAAGIASNDPTLAQRVLDAPGAFGAVGLQLPGLIALSQGFMLTCLVWSAASALLIDRQLFSAARFMVIGAVLAFFGFIHAGTLSPAGGTYELGFGAGVQWAIGYALSAVFFALVGVWVNKTGQQHAPVDSSPGHG
jgi:AGZA family xanthine/uracil permease-like MFS transporter